MLLSLLSMVSPVFAGAATSTFTVSATVVNNCAITTTPLAFGAYDPVLANQTTPVDATGTVTITCTRGAASTVGLQAGQNGLRAVGTTRAMTNSASGYLSYEIYRDSTRTVVWGDSGGAAFTPPVAPSRDPRTYTTYGRIPPGQDVPAGTSYTDTVTATVNF
jgi:spore coat protein U domain-containing protein, fimbrial subunit CupE1/2/3/6